MAWWRHEGGAGCRNDGAEVAGAGVVVVSVEAWKRGTRWNEVGVAAARDWRGLPERRRGGGWGKRGSVVAASDTAGRADVFAASLLRFVGVIKILAVRRESRLAIECLESRALWSKTAKNTD